MRLKEVTKDIWSYYAICDEQGHCDLLSFLSNLEVKLYSARDRLLAIMDTTSRDKNGPRLLNDKVSHIIDRKNKIWQFTAGDLRLLWFYDGGKMIICTTIFIKSSRKTPRSQKEHAIEIKKQYLKDKKDNNLEIDDD